MSEISSKQTDLLKELRRSCEVLEKLGKIDLSSIVGEIGDDEEWTYDNILRHPKKVSYDTELENALCFNSWEEWVTLTVDEFLDLGEAAVVGVLHGHKWCRTKHVSYFYLDENNLDSYIFAAYGFMGEYDFECKEIEYNGNEYMVSIANGLTPFAVCIEREGELEDFNSSFHYSNLFVHVDHDTRALDEDIVQIAKAYLFEVSVCTRFVFSFGDYAVFSDADSQDVDMPKDLEVVDGKKIMRMNMPDLSRGMSEIMTMYHEGLVTKIEQASYLSMIRCIEHVSATVIRLQSHLEIKKKLALPEVFRPTAKYIDSIIEESARYASIRKSDSESLKMTVDMCCDWDMLMHMTTGPVADFLGIKIPVEKSGRKQAIAKIGECLSATRNSLVHAKANYEETGKEYPNDRLGEVLAVAKYVALQAIRWYSRLPEHDRIV